MNCCDSYQNDEPAVSKCSECGSPVDEGGETTRPCCNYSLFACSMCKWAPCYLICKERKDAVHGAVLAAVFLVLFFGALAINCGGV